MANAKYVWLVLVLATCTGYLNAMAISDSPGQPSGPVSHLEQFAVPSESESDLLPEAMAGLARRLLDGYAATNNANALLDRFQLQLAAGDVNAALATLQDLDAQSPGAERGLAPMSFVYGIYAEALRDSGQESVGFGTAYARVFRSAFAGLDDRQAFEMGWYLETPGFVFARRLEAAQAKVHGAETMDRSDATALVKAWLAQRIHTTAAPHVPELLVADQDRRYVIDDSVRIQGPEGVRLSGIVVRPRNVKAPQPTALVFTIYADNAVNRQRALAAASYGYVGMVAHSRGKHLSENEILPYEHEVEDTHAVLDWISRQPWSNGEVGMYGASYEGFAAWAATKRRHPALKTIVPYAAAIPGQGLPMTNNVFLNANYGWVFYVANNRTLDMETYGDRERWDTLNRDWYASGRPYREIDQVDGTPNPLLQRWLDHPAYDAYWQAMVPYEEDYAAIDIPVLTITGYYDDGQISALQYLRDHTQHRPDAEHYLVIGPYDHFGVGSSRKATELRGYRVDPVAQFNTPALIFQWLDYTLRGGDRPAFLKDHINFQVMGANQWRHEPSLEAMAEETLRLYLTPDEEGDFHRLGTEPPQEQAALSQIVDLADRSTTHNNYYPDPIQGREAEFSTGLVFVSESFDEPVEVNGMFGGELMITVNKKDVDLGATLYEMLPDGTLFHLSYWLGRASYAGDPTERRLLVPGELARISLDPTMMVSRRLETGSRLMVVLDVNKNPWHQINYGTGKDVSEESTADAGDPLQVLWHNSSYIDIPLSRLE